MSSKPLFYIASKLRMIWPKSKDDSQTHPVSARTRNTKAQPIGLCGEAPGNDACACKMFVEERRVAVRNEAEKRCPAKKFKPCRRQYRIHCGYVRLKSLTCRGKPVAIRQGFSSNRN